VKAIEIDLPEKIKTQREQKMAAREEVEKTKQEWIEKPWGWPIKPIIDLGSALQKWVEEKGTSC